jgi:hypothetical protein
MGSCIWGISFSYPMTAPLGNYFFGSFRFPHGPKSHG